MEKAEKEKKHQETTGKMSPEREREDIRLQEAYEDTLGRIQENEDEDARDNLSDYMDELKEESENVGRPSQAD